MTIICGWCHATLGYKQPMADKSETTGICPACLDDALTQLKEKPTCTDADSAEPAPGPGRFSADT